MTSYTRSSLGRSKSSITTHHPQTGWGLTHTLRFGLQGLSGAVASWAVFSVRRLIQLSSFDREEWPSFDEPMALSPTRSNLSWDQRDERHQNDHCSCFHLFPLSLYRAGQVAVIYSELASCRSPKGGVLGPI